MAAAQTSSGWTSQQIVTAVIAGLALAVAVISLAWQIVRARRDRRTSLTVRLLRASARHQPIPLVDQILVVAATNTSSHSVRVTKVEVVARSSDGLVQSSLLGSLTGATIPGVVEPRDTGVTAQGLRKSGHWLNVGGEGDLLHAVVHTAEGKTFESPRHRVAEIPWQTQFTSLPLPEWFE